MYSGQFNHQLDDKDRFRIPSKLKEKLGEKIFITAGSTESLSCLFVYSEADAKILEEKVQAVPMFSKPKAQDSLRRLFSNGDEPEQDNQGRYKLLGKLKDWAKIDKNIVFAGAGSRVEIWSEESWLRYNGENPTTPESLNALFEELGQYGL